jgi:hypothetical protein
VSILAFIRLNELNNPKFLAEEYVITLGCALLVRSWVVVMKCFRYFVGYLNVKKKKIFQI